MNYVCFYFVASLDLNLSFFPIDSNKFTLKKYGEYIYGNIILFSTNVDPMTSISLGDILDFVNEGGNLIFATNGKVNDNLRLFAESLGAEFDNKGSRVIDHFSYSQELDTK